MMQSAGEHKLRIHKWICFALIVALTLLVISCGKKADPIPKNPFNVTVYTHEASSVL